MYYSKMHGKIKRSAAHSIEYLLSQFPCVAVLGTRQVGKTTLIKQVLPEAPFFDLERRVDCDRVRRDPDFFFSQYDSPLIIDEAQLVPELFPALRVAIDARRGENGRFLISGSSSPDLAGKLNESLAGRMAVFESLKPRFDTARLFESCLRGGYPEAFLERRDDAKSFALWMENYVRSYLQRDVRILFPGLNLDAYQLFLDMLSRSSGQMVNASDLGRSLGVSQPTVQQYLRIAQGTFVWRRHPSY